MCRSPALPASDPDRGKHQKSAPQNGQAGRHGNRRELRGIRHRIRLPRPCHQVEARRGPSAPETYSGSWRRSWQSYRSRPRWPSWPRRSCTRPTPRRLRRRDRNGRAIRQLSRRVRSAARQNPLPEHSKYTFRLCKKAVLRSSMKRFPGRSVRHMGDQSSRTVSDFRVWPLYSPPNVRPGTWRDFET